MTRIGSRARISQALKSYISALIDLQRLDCIHRLRAAGGNALPRLGERVLAQAGFHATEVWQGRSFRWSEPEAAIRIMAQPGRNVVRIECLDIRVPLERIEVRFYRDGARVAGASIKMRGSAFEVSLEQPSSGTFTLAWICSPFAAVGDARRLGLPVARIDVAACASPEQRDDTLPAAARTG
jgi:hypothetical protein